MEYNKTENWNWQKFSKNVWNSSGIFETVSNIFEKESEFSENLW